MSDRRSPEYYRAISHGNPYWRFLHKLTPAITLGRDCIFPFLPYKDLDHLTYARLGHELPLIDVVPISRTTHKIVTFGRKIPFVKPFINLGLRLAYTTWIVAWVVAAMLAYDIFHPGLLAAQIHIVRTFTIETNREIKNLQHGLPVRP